MIITSAHAEQIAQHQRVEYMRQAEHERLVRQIQGDWPRLIDRLISQIGAGLIAAGQRLQARPISLRSVHQR